MLWSCGATNPCFSKCDDVGSVVAGDVTEYCNMFRSEHEAERILRVQMRTFEERVGPGLCWISPQRRSIAVRTER